MKKCILPGMSPGPSLGHLSRPDPKCQEVIDFFCLREANPMYVSKNRSRGGNQTIQSLDKSIHVLLAPLPQNLQPLSKFYLLLLKNEDSRLCALDYVLQSISCYR